jgi:hypothetical protein
LLAGKHGIGLKNRPMAETAKRLLARAHRSNQRWRGLSLMMTKDAIGITFRCSGSLAGALGARPQYASVLGFERGHWRANTRQSGPLYLGVRRLNSWKLRWTAACQDPSFLGTPSTTDLLIGSATSCQRA